MKRTHTNWSDNSKHSLWLIRRKKLQIVVSLGELFLFVAYWTMIPIFPPDPDFMLVRSRFFISIEWQVWIRYSQFHSFFVCRWLHCECDGLNGEDEAEVAADYGYHCLFCRPRTGKEGPCMWLKSFRHFCWIFFLLKIDRCKFRCNGKRFLNKSLWLCPYWNEMDFCCLIFLDLLSWCSNLSSSLVNPLKDALNPRFTAVKFLLSCSPFLSASSTTTTYPSS